jgi:very-short-patch-repair endonuclease
MRKEVANKRGDAAIARIAANQHGVVSSAQLRAAGLLPSRVADRVAAGHLHRVHRGVYAVGHPGIGKEGRWMAAVLACGEGAVLSHRSAAALWEILKPDRRAGSRDDEIWGTVPGVAVVDVTVAGNGGRAARKGIRLHRSLTLSPADVARRAGIPVTKPVRTLTDLRRVLPNQDFAAALRQAEYLGLPLGEAVSPDHTRSELEAKFLAACRRHRLPPPEVNVPVDRFVVDFLWRKERLIVELDGWESHRARSAFEEDRARDARLVLLGFGVLRFTWRQLEADRRQVTSAIRTLLRR